MKLRITRSRAQVTDISGHLDARSGPRSGPLVVDYRFPPAAKVDDVLVRSQTGCLLSFMLTNNSLNCADPGDDAKIISTCGKEISGIVLGKNPATLKTEKGVVCGHPCVWGTERKDRLLTFEAARDPCGRICGYQVSYIDRSISWSPVKSLFISCGCGTLTIGARVFNGSGTEYPAAAIEFVDTTVPEIGPEVRAEVAEAGTVMSTKSRDLASVRENKSYPISAPLHLHKGETLLSSVETMTLSEMTKFYSAEINETGSAMVDYGYEFVAPDFIPRGVVYIYSVDTCENLMYEGRNYHESANGCEPTKIIVASSIMVTVDAEITERSVMARGVVVDGVVNIRNKTGRSTVVKLRYSRRYSQKWPPISVNPKPSEQLSDELIWQIPLTNTAGIQQVKFQLSFPAES